MKQFRVLPEDDEVMAGVYRYNKMTQKQKRAYVVRFVDGKFTDKPENYRKVVVRNMLRDLK